MHSWRSQKCMVGHCKTLQWTPPSSFRYLHISGAVGYRQDLYSILKECINEAHRNWASRSHLVNDEAGPGAQASQLWVTSEAKLLRLLAPSPPWSGAAFILLCVCRWQSCWLLSGSVWAFFFHPLIKSCTFLIGEQIFKRGRGTLPFRAFRD